MPDITIRSLKGKTAFDTLFRQGKRFKCTEVHLVVRFGNRAEELPLINVGVVVRKKIARTAVLRNRIKRLVRESLYGVAKTSPELLAGIDSMALLWNTTPEHPKKIHLQDVEKAVGVVMLQAHEFCKKRFR